MGIVKETNGLLGGFVMAGAVVLDDVERGARLRRLRRDRHLSQEALGGSRFSASYVSHLEKGRRHLTDEMVDFFADRLGVAAELIRDEAPPTVSAHHAAGAAARQEIERALAQHRFVQASRMADEAIRRAEARGAVTDSWVLSLLRARALFEQDQFPEAAQVAMACADHPLAIGEPALGVEALLIAARSARAEGDFATALRRADRAVATDPASEAVAVDLRAESEGMRIGCLIELGRIDEAVQIATALAGMVDDIPFDHMRGRTQWVLGNVGLLTGNTAEGLARHLEAARLLDPAVDLAAWGRFRRAAAAVRLQHGLTEGVAELIEEAGFALRIIGSASELTGLRLAEARLRLLEGELTRAQQLIDYCAGDEEVARSAYSQAELEELVADLARTRSDVSGAAAAYRRAALKFEEAGSLRRSVEMWRQHSELLLPEQDDRTASTQTR